ncbi:chorion peroxidase-like isoform X3 [Scylla paramamosain]|uniref:chorion peroxidase-like isoform X3 n=1 Tax=Scylla paramamosain TaxID=85552 RepID=UPI003083C651
MNSSGAFTVPVMTATTRVRRVVVAVVAAVITHLHTTSGTVLSNSRPLRGALLDIGGPELVQQAPLVGDVLVQTLGAPAGAPASFAAPVPFSAAGFAAGQQDRVPQAGDYEAALQAGSLIAQQMLQEEQAPVPVAAFDSGLRGFAAAGPGVGGGAAGASRLGLLHFTFRKTQPVAKGISSCRGVTLLEASKYYVDTFNISVARAQESLEQLNAQEDVNTCRSTVVPQCQVGGGPLAAAFSGEPRGLNDPSQPRTPVCDPFAPYRTADGTCNNLNNPLWGSARIPFVRYLSPAYEDGVDEMRGEGRLPGMELPSPRIVSVSLNSLGSLPGGTTKPRPSLLLMQWGQFLDHDLVHTPEATRVENGDTVPITCCEDGVTEVSPNDPGNDCRPIDVSQDPLSTAQGRTCMRFVRSLVASRECLVGPREQMNQVTSYIDGSGVYSSSDTAALELRTRVGGLLDDSANPLPREGARPFLPKEECQHSTASVCYIAGDERVNEQPALTSMHTLWLRVHQMTASKLAAINPHWDDETLYQETRRIVGALLQQITYNEFLPVVLGDDQVRRYNLLSAPGHDLTYDSTVDASVANSFATAAFRFGHSLVKDILQGSQGREAPLVGSFMDPHVLREPDTGPSDLLGGEAGTDADPIDAFLVNSLTHLLFANQGDALGFDLMAFNIQRGRDHGLPAYVTWRQACGLSVPSSFGGLAAIMPAPYIDVFASTYRFVEDIDLFPAGLAENPAPGSLLGPTFSCLLTQQFFNVKHGDRYWYQNPNQPRPFTPEQLDSLGRVTLAGIMCSHLRLTHLQPHVFLAASYTENPILPCSQYNQLDFSAWRDTTTPTPGPITPGPITPGPITPGPITPGPITPGPITPGPIPTPFPSPVECMAVGIWAVLPGMNEWCFLNCLHHPSYCPPSHCICHPRPSFSNQTPFVQQQSTYG